MRKKMISAVIHLSLVRYHKRTLTFITYLFTNIKVLYSFCLILNYIHALKILFGYITIKRHLVIELNIKPYDFSAINTQAESYN